MSRLALQAKNTEYTLTITAIRHTKARHLLGVKRDGHYSVTYRCVYLWHQFSVGCSDDAILKSRTPHLSIKPLISISCKYTTPSFDGKLLKAAISIFSSHADLSAESYLLHKACSRAITANMSTGTERSVTQWLHWALKENKYAAINALHLSSATVLFGSLLRWIWTLFQNTSSFI